MTNKEILNLEFESSDLERIITVREFFKELLTALFKEGECFSGKRPFGNSGWDYDLCVCLAQNEIISGTTSEYGGFTDWDYDSKEANAKILELIKEL